MSNDPNAIEPSTPDIKEDPSSPPQRIDKWLWYARFFKTRSLAAKFVANGHIRLSRSNHHPIEEHSVRIDKPGALVKPNDVLSFMINDRLKIIRVLSGGTRRGPAPEAQTLYSDQSPPPPEKTKDQITQFATRDSRSGRPSKKERRKLNALRGSDFKN